MVSWEFKDFPHVRDRLIEARHMLLSHQLIEPTGQKACYRLTPAGYRFTTFEEYDRQIAENEKHEQLQRNLTRWELRLAKYWWALALFSIIIGLILENIFSLLGNIGMGFISDISDR